MQVLNNWTYHYESPSYYSQGCIQTSILVANSLYKLNIILVMQPQNFLRVNNVPSLQNEEQPGNQSSSNISRMQRNWNNPSLTQQDYNPRDNIYRSLQAGSAHYYSGQTFMQPPNLVIWRQIRQILGQILSNPGKAQERIVYLEDDDIQKKLRKIGEALYQNNQILQLNKVINTIIVKGGRSYIDSQLLLKKILNPITRRDLQKLTKMINEAFNTISQNYDRINFLQTNYNKLYNETKSMSSQQKRTKSYQEQNQIPPIIPNQRLISQRQNFQKHNQLTRQIELKDQQINELKQQLSQKSIQLTSTTMSMDLLNKNDLQIKKQNDLFKIQIQELERIIANLKIQMQAQSKQLKAAKVDSLTFTALNERLQYQNDCLNAEIIEMKAEIESMQSEIEVLKKNLEQQSYKNRANQKFECQLQQAKNPLEQYFVLQNIRTQVLSLIKNLMKEIKQLLTISQVQCDQNEFTLLSIKAGLIQIINPLSILKGKYDASLKLISQISSQVAQLKSQLRLQKQHKPSQTNQCHQMQVDSTAITTPKERLLIDDSERQKMVQMVQEISSLKSKNEKCLHELLQIKKEKEKEKEKEQFDRQLTLLRQQSKNSHLKKEALISRLKQLLKDKRLRKQSPQKKPRKSCNKYTKKELHQPTNSKGDKLDAIVDEYIQTVAKILQNQEKLSTEINQLKVQLYNIKSRLIQSQNELQDCKHRIEDLNQEKATLLANEKMNQIIMQEKDEAIWEIEEEKENMIKEKAQLLRQRAIMEKKVKQMKEQIKEQLSSIALLNQVNKDLTSYNDETYFTLNNTIT